MLTLRLMSAAKGTMENKRPISMNSGVPGGCGTPRIAAAAMNSPQSQNDMVRCTVSPYMIKNRAVVIAAATKSTRGCLNPSVSECCVPNFAPKALPNESESIRRSPGGANP